MCVFEFKRLLLLLLLLLRQNIEQIRAINQFTDTQAIILKRKS